MCSSKHSSHIRPLKLSTKQFCIGLPGAMQRHSMPWSAARRSAAFLVSSVPLFETIIAG